MSNSRSLNLILSKMESHWRSLSKKVIVILQKFKLWWKPEMGVSVHCLPLHIHNVMILDSLVRSEPLLRFSEEGKGRKGFKFCPFQYTHTLFKSKYTVLKIATLILLLFFSSFPFSFVLIVAVLSKSGVNKRSIWADSIIVIIYFLLFILH